VASIMMSGKWSGEISPGWFWSSGLWSSFMSGRQNALCYSSAAGLVRRQGFGVATIRASSIMADASKPGWPGSHYAKQDELKHSFILQA